MSATLSALIDMADTAEDTTVQDSTRLPGEMVEEEGQKVTTESRLTISKIECENFKSYAGVKELGPFHKVSTSRRDGIILSFVRG